MPSLLIVEDEPDIRELLEMTVRSFGAAAKKMRIVGASSAEEAVRVLAREPIDVVLTDHRLESGVTGARLLLEVRDRWPRAQRILMTGFSELPPEEEQEIQQGAQHVLRKPMEPAELRRILTPLLGL
jgi:DNA-binding NtrC family response regulator